MRKVILSVALLAGASTVVQAQSVRLGVKAGASLTSLTWSDTGDTKSVFGFHGGLVANFAVSDAFSVQPEVLYSMKGTKTEGTNVFFGGSTYKLTTRLHYIDMPVLARVTARGLFFELGPQVGFLVAARQQREVSGTNAAGNDERDIKSAISSVDFGYVAGLGYQLSNGPGIGLRYNGGFTDTNKNFGSSAARNSAFQLYLSFMFGGK